MTNRPHDAASSPRRAAAHRARAIAELQHVLESHGWLVIRAARDRNPFALIALASPRSAPPAPGWPPGVRWVGLVFEEPSPAFSLDEMEDVARAHGGRACLASFGSAGWLPRFTG